MDMSFSDFKKVINSFNFGEDESNVRVHVSLDDRGHGKGIVVLESEDTDRPVYIQIG